MIRPDPYQPSGGPGAPDPYRPSGGPGEAPPTLGVPQSQNSQDSVKKSSTNSFIKLGSDFIESAKSSFTSLKRKATELTKPTQENSETHISKPKLKQELQKVITERKNDEHSISKNFELHNLSQQLDLLSNDQILDQLEKIKDNANIQLESIKKTPSSEATRSFASSFFKKLKSTFG